MARQNREEMDKIVGDGGKTRWSEWYLMMSPDTDRRDFERRTFPHEGSRSLINIPECCGIYEWKVKRNLREKVVYIGSSCRKANKSSLRARISRYCTDGSHKCCLINPALIKGYELFVRYKMYDDIDTSEKAENNYLTKYDYAWNIRENGRIRDLHL
jgi:hypothetical protein